MDHLRFTIPEILSLIGITQCVYILVYILFRSGRLSRGSLPFLYFLVLGTAFFLDFGKNYIGEISPYYDVFRWLAWFSGPPLSVLLVIQIAQITKMPDLKHFWVLFLIPLALWGSALMASTYNDCGALHMCAAFYEWLVVSGLLAGGLSLLAIWSQRGIFEGVLIQKTGKARYWLILALIFMNIFLMVTMLGGLTQYLSDNDVVLIRTVLGLGFIYLVTTSLFRIYPQAVYIASPAGGDKGNTLSDQEMDVALRIEKLLELDKIYHETGYSRTDLARELKESEATISKVINLHFEKSFPQLLNEYRVADAKRLLAETQAPVKIVAEEVGFNSLASFNRVFKDLSGISPSDFRKAQKG